MNSKTQQEWEQSLSKLLDEVRSLGLAYRIEALAALTEEFRMDTGLKGFGNDCVCDEIKALVDGRKTKRATLNRELNREPKRAGCFSRLKNLGKPRLVASDSRTGLFVYLYPKEPDLWVITNDKGGVLRAGTACGHGGYWKEELRALKKHAGTEMREGRRQMISTKGLEYGE